MRNYVIGLVLLVMLGWAVYEVVDKHEGSSATARDEGNLAEERHNSLDGTPFAVTDDPLPLEREDTRIENNHEDADQDVVGLKIGQVAPDFELATLDGEYVKLSDYRGKKVFLNFWASWCPPCRAEMPDIERLYSDHPEVQVVAVNLTQTEKSIDAVQKFVEEYNLSFPILLDEEVNVAYLYNIQPIPTSYLIDSKGYIRQIAYGMMTYEMMAEQFSQME